MTHRLSIAGQHHRLHPAGTVETSCAHPPSTQRTAEITPNRTALSGSLNEFTPVSGAPRTFSRTRDGDVATALYTLSP